MACDFRRGGKLKLASKPSHVGKLQAMAEEIRREVDPSAEWLTREDLRNEVVSDASHGGILYPKSAMMHMGRYANGVAQAAHRHGAAIWERNAVTARERVPNGWRAARWATWRWGARTPIRSTVSRGPPSRCIQETRGSCPSSAPIAA
ncbi:FAD-dependent oxidoreductase [Rhizobium sp. F40D2]|uniref:FAD-dependent oxidoreductase n=1 Tax=Rhizobium sp. F40D2 TaxID=3453141 RepID=UPI003F234394